MTPRRILDGLLAALGRPRSYRGSRGTGQRWEALAARHLRAAGYRIRARNVRGRAGEIDLVAEENGVVCFVEVKGRSGVGYGAPGEAVTLEKQRRLARAAEEYVARERLGAAACRFDVVTILETDGDARVEILRGAFLAPDPRRGRD